MTLSISQRRSIIGRAIQIRNTIGIRAAAGYCRNQGLPLNYTLTALRK